MKDWWDNLEAREQMFVMAGGSFLLIALLYALVWLPFDRSHQQLVTSVNSWERSLGELRPLKGLVMASGQSSQANTGLSNQPPIIVVDQTLRSRGLDQYRQQARPTPTGIRVEFENVAFDELVLWLGDLSDQHAMHVQAGSLSIAGQAGPGRINASLTLERAL
ncbi:MAG: type II secretion system protein GspM [Woeseiaceae bacterium]|nr:type II secretion system protein GspM [Woeseiaceae bacterium]